MEYGNQFNNVKTFYEWCVENNRMDLNDRFDTELNKCTTNDVGYKSNKQWYFKCPRGIHDSELYYMSIVTKNSNKDLVCRKCHSLAQIVIDRFGQEYLDDLDAIRELGEGWVAEETLAIALYCSLRYSNSFEKAIIASVNHSGDSDSTGAVTGNIMGAYLGYDAIPNKFKQNLELSSLIEEMGEKLQLHKLQK
jgi:hypothetical protein